MDDQGNTGARERRRTARKCLITITPVNDAPMRTAATAWLLASVPEDTGSPAGDTVNSMFGPIFSDPTDTQTGGSRANALAGVAVAIVGNAATAAQGKWQYDSGSGWTDPPTAPTLAAPFLLKTRDQVRFLPNGNWNGTPGQLTVRLIDDSSGAVSTGAGPNLSGAATGGTTAYSSDLNAVTLGTSITAVNDAPVASGSATLAAINEDTTNPARRAGYRIDYWRQLFGCHRYRHRRFDGHGAWRSGYCWQYRQCRDARNLAVFDQWRHDLDCGANDGQGDTSGLDVADDGNALRAGGQLQRYARRPDACALPIRHRPSAQPADISGASAHRYLVGGDHSAGHHGESDQRRADHHRARPVRP